MRVKNYEEWLQAINAEHRRLSEITSKVFQIRKRPQSMSGKSSRLIPYWKSCTDLRGMGGLSRRLKHQRRSRKRATGFITALADMSSESL